MSEISERAPKAIAVPTTTSEERTAAALTHASTLLTLLVGLPTAGIGGVIFVFLPYLVYLSYREKSGFVAFHAAQAFALQIVLTIGGFLALLVGVLIIVLAWVLTGVLSLILVGLILIPVALLLTLAIIAIWIGSPFVLGAFSFVGAIETAQGRDYHYPYLGQWVEDWLKSHNSTSVVAV